MSNTEASRAYELIVESVINDVREDFENAGIDEQTLQDLKRNWQLKLSETKVADFTWDGAFAGESGFGEMNAAPPLLATSDTSLPAVKEEAAADGSGLMIPAVKEEDVDTNGSAMLPPATPADVPAAPSPHDSTLEESKLQQKQAKRSALLDTDEVGSELDDSDDDYLISEGEDDGPDENLMLCLYDKVTRTKARWKCALKDGVVTINHRDYTFQKAQVEAEWV
ncbi:transcription initiation factor IIA large subunit [Maudiozyma humilis]|uniref:Transcription initiation factor IIA large subunit n=1 Tax=Maudiozyma humilis TaxID=51915 RepID=A0AAV5S0F5_MAUHU|nr:transcription initiation factor IIA large subunit [Kazachstania humilis]